MNVFIRPISPQDFPLLEDFLYEAIFIPEGVEPPSRDIIHVPEVWQHIEGFGQDVHDHGVVAEVDGKVIGAAWARIRDLFGHIDDQTPSLSISLYPAYRSQGIGTNLMHALIQLLTEAGYPQVSLSVQQENYATQMYLNLGFEVVREAGPELVMVRQL